MNVTGDEHPRRAIAERNVAAILDAAERLLARRAQPSISAVAAEAGVSRPTVYAHFEDRQRLLEALVERAVRRATAALESSDPERGPAMEALQRLVASSWQEIGHNEDIGRTAAAELSAEAMRRAHETARAVLARLVERGRREKAFRTDVPPAWLVTSALALIHAAAEAVREGELEPDSALQVLSASVVSLFRA
ncbi:MAG TPA: TetR family transcriptional regulator [Thermoleophilaceae bacterium]|nr:TetR family transcriptional regulator [Thermoleophilaceae bacterium]